MSYVYISDNGSTLGIEGGRLVVRNKKELLRYIPKNTVEAIYIFGNSTITTPCMHYLLEEGIPTCFFSSKGKYFGRLEPLGKRNIMVEKRQIKMFEDDKFCLFVAERVVLSKISNQIVILNRYSNNEKEVTDNIEQIKRIKRRIIYAKSIEEIIGLEGIAARLYFETLGKLIKEEYRFYGRSRRPPKDPFNAMISLGYTILLSEIIAILQTEGLNPYYGFMHKNRNNFPALASDMIEEWRAVLVDSTVMSIINGNEVTLDDFTVAENGGVFLSNALLRKYISKIERKINKPNKYLQYDNKEHSFREAIKIQSVMLKKSIENSNPQLYVPIIIR